MSTRSAFAKFAPLLPPALRAGASPSGSQRLAVASSATAQNLFLPTRTTFAARFAHSIPKPKSALEAEAKSAQQLRRETEPHYLLDFTCVPCDTRSRHKVSKQGYHHGSVLITCPSCRNRHVISDHLGIFGDRKITVEDLMREKGRLVKKGALGEDGDIEFYPEETSTPEVEATEEKKEGSS
ncbi:DNL zinc finger [Colletotrichum musicola]|uniref:DNL zinc finger n=1 Tax=Colletotrichum musicola TaxID=2175873 RepID=A0A8H6NU25_9PEZI|nr:DNL zinc finger [Colletotrichum musicola]